MTELRILAEFATEDESTEIELPKLVLPETEIAEPTLLASDKLEVFPTVTSAITERSDASLAFSRAEIIPLINPFEPVEQTP
jgi:hypothetical protein